MSEQQTIGWRDGKYIYCNSHDSGQVYSPQPVKANDPDVHEDLKCSWCRKKIL
jgi:hypothetical protein